MPAEEEIEQLEYVGHRQRLKARFEQTGFQGFQDYSEAVAFPRRVVEGALRDRAATVIVGHNHPGRLPEPSDNDDTITGEIGKALKTVGITLQEHVIIAPDGFYSYRQNGLFD